MKCDNCGQTEATIHQIHVTDNEIQHLQLCESCAKEQSSDTAGNEAGVEEAFSGLETEDVDSEECSECGTKLVELKQRNKVGCQQCYETFRDQLVPLVHRIHGADQHVGDAPEPSESTSSSGLGKVAPTKKKKMLEKRLQQRVEEEDYERAAELRDRIDELDEENNDEFTG